MNLKTVSKYLLIGTAICAGASCNSNEPKSTSSSIHLLSSLEDMTIESLRNREYNSEITVEAYSTDSCIGTNSVTSLPAYEGTYSSFMASFRSDGLRQYARITVPKDPPPKDGYPFILFLHGYIGADKAADYSIGCRPENMYYSELTDAFARAGFAVLSPGYRGHASVDGVQAEGVEYLEAFDQGAGLSTQFYAIDALNFASGIADIDGTKFPNRSFSFDMSQFFMVGHSQGGDAGLTYLAAIGEGQYDEIRPVHAALWSGTFLDRLSALEQMMPMTMTPEAFLSGDGTWTGTAIGKNGEVNSNFIYGFPPDWIETPNPDEWTWQKDSWSETDVKSATVKSATKMYQDLETNVGGLAGIKFSVSETEDGFPPIHHDARIAETFPNIGAYLKEKFLLENITLHVPEKDHYSRIEWNQDLCDRIVTTGGNCNVIVYSHNNHSMRASPHEWFSPEGTEDGYPKMVKNMVDEFARYGEKNP